MRTVIDTGVAVSAVLLPHSLPRQAFDAAASRGKLLVSEATVAELDEVLRRPKFNKYVSEEKRLEFLAALVRDAEAVEVTLEGAWVFETGRSRSTRPTARSSCPPSPSAPRPRP
jgi:predicted nucleic acid-binding protein